MATTATPKQGDLLDALNSSSTSASKEAKKLLKLWYPRSYNLWMEHNG